MGRTQKAADAAKAEKDRREKGAPARRIRKANPLVTLRNSNRRLARRTALAKAAIARRIVKAHREFIRLQVPPSEQDTLMTRFGNRPTNKLVRSIHRAVRASRLATPAPEVPNA